MKSNRSFIFLTLGICFIMAAFAGRNEVLAANDEPLNVLFVGNSFTKAMLGGQKHSVGQLLTELAEEAGYPVHAETISHGHAYLSDYTRTSTKLSYHKELMTALFRKQWDYVVLQEQSKAPLNNIDQNTYAAIMQLKDLIEFYQPQTEILLYMTHGFDDGSTTLVEGERYYLTAAAMQERIAAAYSYLENRTGLKVVPVGMQFARCKRLFPHMPLIYSDQWHPDFAGYYLAAACFYYELFGVLPVGYPDQLTDCDISESQLRDLESLITEQMYLDRKAVKLRIGETVTLAAVLRNAERVSSVHWKSFNNKVASVDSRGKVTAVASGFAVIMAISSDGRQACSVIDVEIPMKFRKTDYMVAAGDELMVRPQGTTKSLVWQSSNERVATVSATGVIKALAAGRVRIQARERYNSNSKAFFYLYVSNQEPATIKIVKTTAVKATVKFGRIKTTWKKVRHATKYRVYRSATKNRNYRLIGTTRKNYFTDKKVPFNRVFFYKVVAANRYEKCDSEMSVSTRSVVLKTPELLTNVHNGRYARLKWQRNAGATGYIIYRSSKKNARYKELVTIKTNSRIRYIDKNVKKKKKYYYKIMAYRNLDGMRIDGGRSSSEVRIENAVSSITSE